MSKSMPMRDDSLDRILRDHYRGRGGASESRCAGFDPNLASAYEEGTLAPTARRAFQEHLAACQSCRTDWADFTLTLRVDATPTLDGEERQPLLARVRAFVASLGSLGSPQWAMAVPALGVVLLGGLAWWVVSSRTAGGPDVAMAPRNEAAQPAATPQVPTVAGGQATHEVDKPATPEPGAGVEGAPRRSGGAKPAPPAPAPRPRPSRTRPDVDDSVTRSAQPAEPAAESSRVRRAGGKTFLLVGGAWTDRAYLGRDRGREYAAQTIERGSAAFEAAVQRAPALAEYGKLGERVVVLQGDTVYTIVAPK
jgi:hypothetical protein